MFAGDFPNYLLAEAIDMDKVYVDFASKNIFLCGGQIHGESSECASMREAFFRQAHKPPFCSYEIHLAEDVSREYQSRRETYDDLMLLESDIAQLSNVILLFSESYGSVAELAAFCMESDISERLLILISEKHNEQGSFIKLGPLTHLRKAQGDGSVCVIPNYVCDLKKLNGKSLESRENFFRYVDEAFKKRLETITTHKTFDKRNRGHLVLFLTGIVRYYHALELEELLSIASTVSLDMEEKDIVQSMFCAIVFRWIVLKDVGSRHFYVIKSEKDSLIFKKKNETFDRERWKTDILNHWKKVDQQRFDAILTARRT